MLKNLIDKISYLDVYKCLKACYELDHNTIIGHLHVLYQWRNMEPIPSNMVIVAQMVEDPEGSYWHINGEIPDSEYDSCGLDFTPWAEWLGMEYRKPKDLSDEEFVAHCLWEATFYGFTEDAIKNIYQEVCENIDEVIEELKPFEKPLDIQSVLR